MRCIHVNIPVEIQRKPSQTNTAGTGLNSFDWIRNSVKVQSNTASKYSQCQSTLAELEIQPKCARIPPAKIQQNTVSAKQLELGWKFSQAQSNTAKYSCFCIYRALNEQNRTQFYFWATNNLKQNSELYSLLSQHRILREPLTIVT